MSVIIVPIVEGYGEESAIRIVIDRITAELNLGVRVRIVHPIRQKRDRLLKPGEFERAIQAAAIQALATTADHRRVLVLIDSDGVCPATLCRDLLGRARQARSDIDTSVVLAHHEFEAWFLASASSLRECCGLSEAIEDHPSPETVQGAKEWLRQHMPANRKYSERVDQPTLTHLFDLNRAREGSRSFRKFWKEIEHILRDSAG
jgi:hypothetical protein